MSPETSDEQLMEEIRDGNARAFQILYERHHKAVFNFLLRHTGNQPIAEELLQETFLRVYLARDRYHPTATLRTWLFTIARNLSLDLLRQKRPDREQQVPELLEGLADPAPTAVQKIEGEELAQRLTQAIACLPSSQREVLLLSRFGGLTHEEIAAVTETSPGAVRVNLHRALGHLKGILGFL